MKDEGGNDESERLNVRSFLHPSSLPPSSLLFNCPKTKHSIIRLVRKHTCINFQTEQLNHICLLPHPLPFNTLLG
ncbi:MAG: hypothetical protein DMF68_21770 [Acidobacteria bacterium]|nr:MAG: hypothetical protein DMF68_21770 [Acidobacteriota bacterium]